MTAVSAYGSCDGGFNSLGGDAVAEEKESPEVPLTVNMLDLRRSGVEAPSPPPVRALIEERVLIIGAEGGR